VEGALLVGVGLGQEAVDSFLQRNEGMKDAAYEAPLGELAKKR
jgi:hypothetical protein